MVGLFVCKSSFQGFYVFGKCHPPHDFTNAQINVTGVFYRINNMIRP